LDFFAGSGTTADVVYRTINGEKSHSFILIQIPEKIEILSGMNPDTKKSIKKMIEFLNRLNKPLFLTEIGKERIRRAGEKIIADNPDKSLSNLDIGFKIFKLDSSNIKEWDSDFDNLEQNLLDATENIKEDRTSEDLLYEILLKYGLDLTLPIEEKILEGKKVFIIGYGALVVCLDNDITTDIVERIAKLKEEYETQTMRVVFKDSSFKNAVVKTNAIQILKQYGIDEVVSV
jgi:adenine-specific DNA-methyltransferase